MIYDDIYRKTTETFNYGAVSQARKRLQEKIKSENERGKRFNAMQSKLGQMSRINGLLPK